MQENPRDDELREILQNAKTIAVVGYSPNAERPSHWIAEYLQKNGYRVIPVNPALDVALGEKCYKTISEIPDIVDIVNIFRSPPHVPQVVHEAITRSSPVIWMQEGAENMKAADEARSFGITTVVGRCIYRDHASLIRGI